MSLIPSFRLWLIWLLTIHSSSIDTNVPLEVWDVITLIQKTTGVFKSGSIFRGKIAEKNFEGARRIFQKVPRIPSHPFFKREIYFIPKLVMLFCKICGKLKQGVYIDVSPSGELILSLVPLPGVSQCHHQDDMVKIIPGIPKKHLPLGRVFVGFFNHENFEAKKCRPQKDPHKISNLFSIQVHVQVPAFF